MSKYTMFDEKKNTLYINSDLLLPNTTGMDFKTRHKEYDKAFKMDYMTRLEKFCPENVKPIVKAEIEKHKGCKFSEYCSAF